MRIASFYIDVGSLFPPFHGIKIYLNMTIHTLRNITRIYKKTVYCISDKLTACTNTRGNILCNSNISNDTSRARSDFQFISIIRIVQLDTRIFIALISMCISAAMLNRHERYCVPRVQPWPSLVSRSKFFARSDKRNIRHRAMRNTLGMLKIMTTSIFGSVRKDLTVCGDSLTC